LTAVPLVTRIPVMTIFRSMADVRARFSEILDSVETVDERVVVTRRGKPVAVIMSVDAIESLEDTLDILATPGALDQIRRAEADIDRGDYLTAEQLRAKYPKK
jgi:antitoxin YefM